MTIVFLSFLCNNTTLRKFEKSEEQLKEIRIQPCSVLIIVT